MELNGISNLHIILDGALAEGKVTQDVHKAAKKQLELLERYMVAISSEIFSAKRSLTPDVSMNIPEWHSLLSNPEKYPTVKERRAAR